MVYRTPKLTGRRKYRNRRQRGTNMSLQFRDASSIGECLLGMATWFRELEARCCQGPGRDYKDLPHGSLSVI